MRQGNLILTTLILGLVPSGCINSQTSRRTRMIQATPTTMPVVVPTQVPPRDDAPIIGVGVNQPIIAPASRPPEITDISRIDVAAGRSAVLDFRVWDPQGLPITRITFSSQNDVFPPMELNQNTTRYLFIPKTMSPGLYKARIMATNSQNLSGIRPFDINVRPHNELVDGLGTAAIITGGLCQILNATLPPNSEEIKRICGSLVPVLSTTVTVIEAVQNNHPPR